jgi:L-alanine-DL-glutamate epimerase-like enolase superfamily enzyme
LECGDAAAACGLASMMGGMMETRLGVTASTHAALARGVFQFFDLDAHKDHAIDPIIGGIWHDQGMVETDESVGLGAAPDPSWLAEFDSIVIE